MYLLSIFIPFIIIISIVFFVWWYEKPTCFDLNQNGDEVGIDCGGSCQILCSSQALDPVVLWNRSFEVYPGVYNLVAYVENPNIASEVSYATYLFKVYDKDNNIITERKGVTSIPQRKTFVIFEGTVRTSGTIPARISFEFINNLEWSRVDTTETAISVESAILTGTNNTPRVDVVLKNEDFESFQEVEVSVVVFDSENNAIQASRTIVEDLMRGQEKKIVFTWPTAFDAGTEVCATPVDVALVIDRSGSMNDDGDNPPEPLTAVKSAAESFVRAMDINDSVALISFATEASLDSDLSSGLLQVQDAIKNVAIGPNENTQHTNIFDGLQSAYTELISNRGRASAQNIIILLTDGIASRPVDSNDTKYAVNQALSEANKIKSWGTSIYTIGLGASVDSGFLSLLATSPEYYYRAPSTDILESIYAQIATAICKKGPNIIQIIPRVLK